MTVLYFASGGCALLLPASCLQSLPADGAPAADEARNAVAQNAPFTRPSFEVISIRPNKFDRSGHSHLYYSLGDSHFRAVNASVLQLILFAYALPDSRIPNAPEWIKSEKFDIDAESGEIVDRQFQALAPDAAREQKQKLVQSLLVDRFHLLTHRERRTVPVYALVVDKRGTKFSPVHDDGPRHTDTSTHSGATSVSIVNNSDAMAALAEILTRFAGRYVVDKTGLRANYSISLKFGSDDLRSPLSSSDAQDTGPSVFTALREQLGLTLQPEKAGIDVLVIDHVEAPTPN
jgi:uncharacterized protein (TIGR03435 family)